MHKFSLGQRVNDTLTGYFGRVTAIHLSYGAPSYKVENTKEDGTIVSEWLDESRLAAHTN